MRPFRFQPHAGHEDLVGGRSLDVQLPQGRRSQTVVGRWHDIVALVMDAIQHIDLGRALAG
ncbi:MAG: hypothetical protein WDN06_04670 [Asticcacaulis sp.]